MASGERISENGEIGRESTPFRRTAFEKHLAELEEGDAIGIVEAIFQTLEHLETEEAVDGTQIQTATNDRDNNTIGNELLKGPYQDFSADGAEPGPNNTRGILVTSREVEAALSGEKIAKADDPILSSGMRIDVCHENKERKREIFSSRFKFRKPLVDREKDECNCSQNTSNNPKDIGLFGSSYQAPITEGLAKYFATVGSTHEKRVVALSAWALTIVALLVCLVFVTKDFLQSNREATIALSYELEEHFDVPETYICSTQVAFPAFAHQPTNKFSGEPFLWVKSLKMPGNTSQKVFYPATQSHQNIEFVNVDAFGNRCRSPETTFADASGLWKALREPPGCFNCILIKNKPPIRILRSDVEGNQNIALDDAARAASFEVEVSQSLLVEACRGTQNGLASIPFAAARRQIASKGDALRSRGILDFGNISISGFQEYIEYFPLQRLSRAYGYTDRIVADVVDVVCNTALFSGFFYPATPSQDISFVFNHISRRWDRNKGSKGPYYPPIFEEWYVQPEMKEGVVVPGQVIFPKPQLDIPYQLDVFGGRQEGRFLVGTLMKVFLGNSHSEGSPLTQIAAIRQQGVDTVFFVRHSNNNNVTFSSTNEEVTTFTVDGRNVNNNFLFQLTSREFYTRKVSDQVTVQVTSFLADFFGLVELFLDLSVYTLIVSPVVVSTRRRALAARIRTAAAAPISPV